MNRELEPTWTDEERAAAERHRKAWEEFFDAERGEAGRPTLGAPDQGKIAAVQAEHAQDLMRYPNVVGVAPGFRTRGGQPVDEPCLVVYVERKLPASELSSAEILPTDIDGVPVDVVEVGRIQAQ
jgi:hypothetical protein